MSQVALTFVQEYILSSLKVITIIAFIIIGVFVNVGVNREHSLIGFSNWFIKDAPFVNGLHGFARVFVTASFACMYSDLRNGSICTSLNHYFQMGEQKV